MNADFQKRIDRLKAQVTLSGVGILCETADGWVAHTTAGTRTFKTEQEARVCLDGCQAVIIVDV